MCCESGGESSCPQKHKGRQERFLPPFVADNRDYCRVNEVLLVDVKPLDGCDSVMFPDMLVPAALVVPEKLMTRPGNVVAPLVQLN